MPSIYDNHGIRFEFPAGWEVDETDPDEGRITITVQSPDAPTFVLVTLDPNRPAPEELLEEALSAMREEYPGLESIPVHVQIQGHRATGFDLEFFSLDLLNECRIRAFRTPIRTVMTFGQWSDADLDDNEPEDIVNAIWNSLEETDS